MDRTGRKTANLCDICGGRMYAVYTRRPETEAVVAYRLYRCERCGASMRTYEIKEEIFKRLSLTGVARGIVGRIAEGLAGELPEESPTGFEGLSDDGHTS